MYEIEKGKCYERILYHRGDTVYLIDIYGNSMPYIASTSHIQTGLEKGTIQFLEIEPFIIIASEDEILPKHKKIRDKAYDAVKEIISIQPDIYIPNKRTRLVRDYVHSIHETTAMRYLKRYWQRGMHKNALLPDYYNCGGQSTTANRETFSITSEVIKIFNTALNRFYYNSSQKTLTLTYELMIKEYFTEEGIIKNNIPSLRQFRYWFNKERNIKKEISTRHSSKEYELKHRGLTGSATEEAFGPGAVFQIDATVGDVYLVSRFNRNWIIGRPVIYAIIDVFSRCVVGINISLEGPSWIGASVALTNVVTNKVIYCRDLGIEIGEDEWDFCSTLPEAIVADRGELEGYNVESLISAFGIKILNTASYRGDFKSVIERYFSTLAQHTKPFMPGAIKSQYRERGEQDYRLSATLDLEQFTQIIIKCVLYHNNHHYLKNYVRSEDMIADGVEPIPRLIWEWGIVNRTGKLRTVDENLLKLNLLPNDKATVTQHGIRYKSMLYGSKKSLKERWFEKARNNGVFCNNKMQLYEKNIYNIPVYKYAINCI